MEGQDLRLIADNAGYDIMNSINIKKHIKYIYDILNEHAKKGLYQAIIDFEELNMDKVEESYVMTYFRRKKFKVDRFMNKIIISF